MRTIIATVLFFVLTSACNFADKEQVALQNDSLLSIANQGNEKYIQLLSAFHEIELNLDSIEQSQNLVTVNMQQARDVGNSQKERIKSEVATINQLMDRNRNLLVQLKTEKANSKFSNNELDLTISIINRQFAWKNLEFEKLNKRMIELKVGSAPINLIDVEPINMKAESIQSTGGEISEDHAAYYILGSSQALKNAGIIDHKGGLLGLGSTVDAVHVMDNSKFIKVDNKQTKVISVNNYIRIITVHPTYSYKLERDINHKDMIKNIVITDPDRFWRDSKYLVMVVD